jgi:hypothetical protein
MGRDEAARVDTALHEPSQLLNTAKRQGEREKGESGARLEAKEGETHARREEEAAGEATRAKAPRTCFDAMTERGWGGVLLWVSMQMFKVGGLSRLCPSDDRRVERRRGYICGPPVLGLWVCGCI